MKAKEIDDLLEKVDSKKETRKIKQKVRKEKVKLIKQVNGY